MSRTIVMLLGPPGAGKGTHAPAIVKWLDLPQIAMGCILREAVAKGTDIGKVAKEKMDKGQLVDADIIVGIIKDRIAQPDCAKGFILDGTPRCMAEVEMLDVCLAETRDQVTSVIEFHIPDEVLKERIQGRWIHKASGRSYHAKFNPPRSLGDAAPSSETMRDDETGEPLVQRSDDMSLEALEERLRSFHTDTEPILEHYSGVVHRINADQPMDKVWAELQQVLPPQGKASMPALLAFFAGVGRKAEGEAKPKLGPLAMLGFGTARLCRGVGCLGRDREEVAERNEAAPVQGALLENTGSGH